MALKDLKEDLEERDSIYANREHDKTIYDEWNHIDEKRDNKSLWTRTKDVLADGRLRSVFIAAIGISFAAIIGVSIILYVKYQRSFFTEENVVLTMHIAEAVVSNRETEVVLTIENKNRAQLDDVDIIVRYGQYFQPTEAQKDFQGGKDERGLITIGTIDPNSTREVVLRGTFAAPENDVESISANLRYTPQRSDKQRATESQVSTTVTSSPIIATIISEKEVVSGNLVDLIVEYRNASEETIENVFLTMQYPPGFSFIESDPGVSQDQNIWSLGTLSADEKGTIRIRGAVTGNVDNVENISASLSVGAGAEEVAYSRATHAYRVIAAPVTLVQSVIGDTDGVIRAGQHIEYDISFKNTGDTPLRDVVLRLFIDGEAPDYESLHLKTGGFYDRAKREIVWKASDVPALGVLNPGDMGKVGFTVTMKNILPVDTLDDKNFTVTTVMSLDSNDVSSTIRENKNILSNARIIKVAAKPLIDAKIEHLLGPLPPRVGLGTTYRVTLRAGSVNNDLHNVVVKGLVPSGIDFVPQAEAEKPPVVLNERSNEFIWNIGKIDSGTGVITPLKEAVFDIVLTPSVNDVNALPSLIKGGLMTGHDAFLGQDFTENLKGYNTQSIPGGSFSSGSVQPL